MDHSDHTGMDMSSITSTMTEMAMGATSTVMSMATSTSTGSMDHSSMDSDSSMSMGGCKINMMLNWYTIDACFISEEWHITSEGMFAGSCIGVVCLAVFLEFLRRSVKEYDRLLIKQHVSKYESLGSTGSGADSQSAKDNTSPTPTGIPPFRPNFWQQAIRAILHTAQFTVAYFIMLLAMYYNVYILVSIFLGILVGSYLFQYETLEFAQQSYAGGREPTVCCG